MPCWVLKSQIKKTDNESRKQSQQSDKSKKGKKAPGMWFTSTTPAHRKNTQGFKVILEKQKV